jgi:hypothetical protein
MKYSGYALETTRLLKWINEYLGRVYKDWEYFGEIIIEKENLEEINGVQFDEICRDKRKEEDEKIAKVLVKLKKEMIEKQLKNYSL